MDNGVFNNNQSKNVLKELANLNDSDEQIEQLKARVKELEKENADLKAELTTYRNNNSNGSRFPSSDEIKSISSMIDIVKKLDDSTINRLERLGRKNA